MLTELTERDSGAGGSALERRARMALVFVACVVLPFPPANAQYPSVPPPPPCHDPRSARVHRAPGEVDARSIGTVLFQNTASDGDDAFLSRALTNRLTERLQVTGSARVVPSQRFSYEQVASPGGAASVGRALGVANILTARVGRATTGEVSIDAIVLRASDGTAVWKMSSLATESDLPALEARMTSAILEAVTGGKPDGKTGAIRLAGWSDPPSGETVEHFLRGEFYESLNTAPGYESALAQYDSAAKSDPAFAPGFARSALTTATILEWGWWDLGPRRVRVMTDRGLAAADRALRLDSASADAWIARASLLGFRNPKSYAGVLGAYTRALKYSPRSAKAHHWYGRALMQLGDRASARRELARALELAPGDAGVLFDLGQLARNEGRYSEACIVLDSAVVANPRAGQPYVLRALTRARRGELRFAWADAETGGRLGWPLWGQAASAVVDAQARDTASARQRAMTVSKAAAAWGAEPQQWTGEYLAIALVAGGETKRALDLLERVQPRGARLWFALTAPEFAPLRKNQRFRDLLAASRPRR